MNVPDVAYIGMTAEELERRMQEVRNQALEEAAKVCEGINSNGDGAEWWLRYAAAAIRALKEKRDE